MKKKIKKEKYKELLRKWYIKGQLDGMIMAQQVYNNLSVNTLNPEELEILMDNDLSQSK